MRRVVSNLYQPKQPRMLGVGGDFIARDGFVRWADPPAGRRNPWEVLSEGPPTGRDYEGRARVLDQTTANYAA